jgi:hypothetical protein
MQAGALPLMSSTDFSLCGPDFHVSRKAHRLKSVLLNATKKLMSSTRSEE